ncbi:MAG: hypothetical protein AAB368_08025, partial [bacterium]
MAGLAYGIFLCSAVLSPSVSSGAYIPQPIVLVHGKGSIKDAWNKIKDDLELRLPGVQFFRYSFDNREGAISQWGRELGDRSYLNPAAGMDGQCWLEKIEGALGGPPPHGYRLVGHSAGSLAIRQY